MKKIKLKIFFLDSRSVQLKNTRGNIQRKAGTALYNLHESVTGDWQTFSDNNIRLAEQVWLDLKIDKKKIIQERN